MALDSLGRIDIRTFAATNLGIGRCGKSQHKKGPLISAVMALLNGFELCPFVASNDFAQGSINTIAQKSIDGFTSSDLERFPSRGEPFA
jgi:hypothetical protein